MSYRIGSISLVGFLSSVAAIGGCGGAANDSFDDDVSTSGLEAESAAPADSADSALRTGALNPARSLGITAASVLQPCLTNSGLTACGSNGQSTFSLRRTLEAILRTAGRPTTGANDLARQLWDTHNTKANAQIASSPHCDDVKNAAGQSTLNGFPVQCPRNEGAMATASTDMLTPASAAYFYPIGLFNRTDLRSEGTCGEFRIIYGRKDANGIGVGGRALIIFEASLPNPRPELGTGGCQPIAKMWSDLSASGTTSQKARDTLAKFYYEGVTFTYADGVAATTRPVVHFEHLGAVRGQIRTNEFMNGASDVRWQLREYKTRLVSGALVIAPEYVKGNAWPGLFASATGVANDPFSAWFLSQVPSLSARGILSFGLADAPQFGAGQSDAHTTIVGSTGDATKFSNDYALFVKKDGPFWNSIQTKLTSIGSKLTPKNVLDRATAASCGGCHQHSNNDDLGGGLIWPASATFVQVDETPGTARGIVDAFGASGKSFAISAALSNVFLPARATDLTCVASPSSCAASAAAAPAALRVH